MNSLNLKMEPGMKARWGAALRSGKYKQGTGILCNTNEDEDGNPTELTYCCLGVLNEIEKLGCEGGMGYLKDKITQEYLIIPKIIQDILIDMNDGPPSMTNDSPNMSFDEIADWIDENL